jgi:hypothetical protein
MESRDQCEWILPTYILVTSTLFHFDAKAASMYTKVATAPMATQLPPLVPVLIPCCGLKRSARREPATEVARNVSVRPDSLER